VRRPALAAVALALAGCGGGGGASSCPPFTQIVAGDFGRTDDTIWWTLEVEALPETLKFDEAGLPEGVLEYSWGVDLDSDRDHETDLSVSLVHFKYVGATTEVVTGDILSQTKADLWKVSGTSSQKIGNFDATISGSTFRFETGVAADPGLATVTDRAQMLWTTYYYKAGAASVCRGHWPEQPGDP
jgi:hypothetical protein